MSIDRTNYNALIDDDGSNTVGTLWNKNVVKTVLLDPIDAALGALTGNPTAPTPPPGDNDTSIATTAFVTGAIAAALPLFNVLVHNSVAQALTNGTFTVLTFDSEDFDIGNLHNPAVNPSRLTVPAGGAGLYLIIATVTCAGSAGGSQRQANVLLNGGGYGPANIVAPSAAYEPQNLMTLLAHLNVGDYIEVREYQDSGGSLNTSPAKTFLGMTRLSA